MFGKRLRELRKQKKLTMKELGNLFNLAESTISGYENETRKPDMEIIKQFADFFEVSVDYLLGRTNDPSPSLPEELEDPEISVFFKDYLSSPKEKQEELRKIWEIIKVREAGRKPGDKQK
ncbi:helix-turn-helix domain-containing protein [Tepidibacillus fermentans]|uniref:Transcriptional regulator with XRE-family HTH domain n=1 Tax=Tepidibacillus fermentans TaxID=1281767 RepID=A0A4R3KBB6_9BACI|nr:helix-turn-helix transcriptional regulator [Tepidibacillus fermentans]TCS80347.1 transcriptional regulator with XRE-family HTH domain [Tepidibacillus fermentans]